MRTRTVTLYICDICGYESERQEDTEYCESFGKPPMPDVAIGQEVFLDARGLKDGNAYCKAAVTDISLERSENIIGSCMIWGHEWVLSLDRGVHLCECWGEGGMDLDPWQRSWVTSDCLLDPDEIDETWREVTANGDEMVS